MLVSQQNVLSFDASFLYFLVIWNDSSLGGFVYEENNSYMHR